MRRYLPAFLLVLLIFAPFPIAGCDLIAKLKGADGGIDGATISTDASAVVTSTTTTPQVTETPPPAPRPTVTSTARPTADAGRTDAAIDATAPAVDAGRDSGPAPVPTPTFRIPTQFLDGGLLRIDAGNFKPPWVK